MDFRAATRQTGDELDRLATLFNFLLETKSEGGKCCFFLSILSAAFGGKLAQTQNRGLNLEAP